MSLDVVILGPPGSGKGTQAKRIVATTGIAHISTGDILRAAIEDGRPLGQEVREVYDRGELVSDELMIRVMRARLLLEDAASGALLDGFPRTLAQARGLDDLFEDLERRLALVLDLHVPEEVSFERLLARAGEEGRRDDTPDVIRNRLEIYHSESERLIGYYRAKGILAQIRGDRSEDEVFADVENALEAVATRHASGARSEAVARAFEGSPG